MAAPDPDDDTRAQAEALLADLLGRNLAQAQAVTRQHTDPLTRADLDAALANLVTKDDLAQAVAALATKDSVRADVAESKQQPAQVGVRTRPRDRHPRRRRLCASSNRPPKALCLSHNPGRGEPPCYGAGGRPGTVRVGRKPGAHPRAAQGYYGRPLAHSGAPPGARTTTLQSLWTVTRAPGFPPVRVDQRSTPAAS